MKPVQNALIGLVAGLLAGGVAMKCNGAGEDRLADAVRLKRKILLQKCLKAGLAELPTRLYLRAFKAERQIEVWGFEPSSKRYVLIESYRIAAMSGSLGPKRREGDLQVPEGLYRIDRFNPLSQFLLSLRVNYPNDSDRIFSDKDSPGSDIYIHGGKASIGCLAMTDDSIREIYVLAHTARKRPIPVHIFPARFEPGVLEKLSSKHPEHADLWRQIEPAYRRFERTRLMPTAIIDSHGAYRVHQ